MGVIPPRYGFDTVPGDPGGAIPVALGYLAAPDKGTITNDAGPDATVPLVDGTNAGLMAPAQHAKLASIAAGATANSSDASLRDRSTHSGTQAAATISDLAEAVQDIIGSALVAGANVSMSYDDGAGTITISAAGGGGGGATNLGYTPGATQGVVTSDTGADATLPLADGTNAGLMAPAQHTKLAGIATGATANSSDASLRDRSTHSGTQAAATISDLAEAVQDIIGAALAAGANVSVNYNDTTGAITIGLSGVALTAGTLAQFASTSSAQLAGVIGDKTGTGNLVFGTEPTLTGPALAAGTATVPPLKFTSGALLTTPAAGAGEYDGKVFYLTGAASKRQAVDAEQFICLTSNYTLTSQTAAQKLFNSTTDGALSVLASTLYFFECEFALGSLSSTSGSFGFALGGTATLTHQFWQALANKVASQSTGGNATLTQNYAANAALVAANTSINGICQIKGRFRTSAAGTIIPQVSLGVAAAALVQNGSFFRCWAVGDAADTALGDWS